MCSWWRRGSRRAGRAGPPAWRRARLGRLAGPALGHSSWAPGKTPQRVASPLLAVWDLSACCDDRPELWNMVPAEDSEHVRRRTASGPLVSRLWGLETRAEGD